jgi:hypothetical protein
VYPAQIEHRIDLPNQMIRRHHPVEIKPVKELALSNLSLPHHGLLPRIAVIIETESRFPQRHNESFATQSSELTSGFALVLSWLAQKWNQRCRKLALLGSKNPEQHLTKEQQKACLEMAAAELIREITQGRSLN